MYSNFPANDELKTNRITQKFFVTISRGRLVLLVILVVVQVGICVFSLGVLVFCCVDLFWLRRNNSLANTSVQLRREAVEMNRVTLGDEARGDVLPNLD